MSGTAPGRPGGRRAATGPAPPPAPTCAASAAKYRSRSAGSAHTVTASSAWSTTSVCRPRAFKPAERVQSGAVPGVVTRTGVPPRTSDATTPARTSEDFPMPDGPTTARTRGVTQPTQARRDVVLPPEERVGVLGVVRQQPAVGTDRADLLLRSGASGTGPAAAAAPRSRRTHVPGSSPSSSTSIARARFSAPRPPPDGPPGTRPSRAGPSAAPGTAPVRPVPAPAPAPPARVRRRISASTRSSSASIRRPSSRAASTRPGSHSSRSRQGPAAPEVQRLLDQVRRPRWRRPPPGPPSRAPAVARTAGGRARRRSG